MKTKQQKIVQSIAKNKNKYFELSHFAPINMADATLMKYTIRDLRAVYKISYMDATAIIRILMNINK